jgi:protein phosphatase
MAVADGMGGHSAGEVASSIAVSQIRDLARQALGGNKDIVPEGGTSSLSRRGRQLEWFVKTANTTIYKKGREAAKERGMGTTVVAVLADARSMTVAHVGDSRLYLFRNGALTQLTEDHSLVGDQVRKGLLTSDEASRSTLHDNITVAAARVPTEGWRQVFEGLKKMVIGRGK